MDGDEEMENLLKGLPERGPAPEARERILSTCRREMAVRVARERGFRRWSWAVAALILLLTTVDLGVQRHFAVRIAAILEMPAETSISTRRENSTIAALRLRNVQMSALLGDEKLTE